MVRCNDLPVVRYSHEKRPAEVGCEIIDLSAGAVEDSIALVLAKLVCGSRLAVEEGTTWV